jgi:Raf kinase inhibitor-like YbhB/YbcL family protein
MKGGFAMVIMSHAFGAGGAIPRRFTVDGDNISPPLSWEDVPEKTKSFALICDDPDAAAGTWVHWVIFNISADTRELPEKIPPMATPLSGMIQGRNDFQRIGYGGPSPPRGTHRYFFSLYALDTLLNLPPGAAKQSLLSAMRSHILAEAKLMGTYSRG